MAQRLSATVTLWDVTCLIHMIDSLWHHMVHRWLFTLHECARVQYAFESCHYTRTSKLCIYRCKKCLLASCQLASK